jgi:hypothetical protein
MGSSAVHVIELLQRFDATNGALIATIGNVTADVPAVKVSSTWGNEHAIDTTSNVLYTQSRSSGGVSALDLTTNTTLPPLAGTAGTALMCLHFDRASGLGAIIQDKSNSSALDLVSIDMKSGAMSSRVQWDADRFPGKVREWVCERDRGRGRARALTLNSDSNHESPATRCVVQTYLTRTNIKPR